MEDGCHMLGPHSMHSAVQVDFSQQAACCVDSAFHQTAPQLQHAACRLRKRGPNWSVQVGGCTEWRATT